ncbi:hypothetical protein FRC19_008329 [Serendipita sp. 401]|nr:hypothetical protein FRC19_008329 [Serendipita sp. 401]KAG9058708.1 hypothetical protein FS842_003497 [Serendipita sp. 407]
MLFFVTPQSAPQYYYEPEESLFSDYKRRQYIAALQEQEQRAQFEHELALEEQRHRIALQSIARKESARRQQEQANTRFARYAAPQPQYSPFGCGNASRCQPSSEEILKRRLARQQEEEQRSREFHEHILSQIFGGALRREGSTQPEEKEKASTSAPAESTSTDKKGKGKATEPGLKRPREEEQEPHWSAAPQRARSLAEITSIHRTFNSLKNTFAFPSGPLDRLPESDVPRLAYNSTNASIHAYEHALSELLTKLDGIESHGFKGVREARKQLVVKIEQELEALERQIAERLAETASPAKGTVSMPAETTTPTEVIVPIEAPSGHEEDVIMGEPTTSAAKHIAEDIEVAQPSVSDNAVTAGYDVELDQEPTTQDNSRHIEEAKSMEVEAAPTDAQVAVNDEPATTSPVEVDVSASAIAPAEVGTVQPQVEIDTAADHTSSDEESEIEDAVQIDVSSEDEDRHEGDQSDGAFEMI